MYNYDQSFYSCALQFAPHNKPMMHFAKMAAKMAAEQAAAGKKVEPSPFAGNTMAYGASFGCVPTGEGSVLFQMLTVPGAKVEVGGMRGTAVYDLGKVEMKEVEPGFYQGEAHGWAPGFQYIEFTVNGVPTMNDRAPIGYGYSRAVNFCEVPGSEEEMNVYMLKDVPHGSVHMEVYFSRTTGMWRNCVVYTPPGYDPVNCKYPTLYLQHGGGEDETGWLWQGKINYICDNLLAAGKIEPMLVVMNAGYAFRAEDEYDFVPGDLGKVLRDDCIPMIESKYAVYTDREHRAMAGLSMGSYQTQVAIADYPELFAYEGILSGTVAERMAEIDKDMNFADVDKANEMKLIFISCGTSEERCMGQMAFIDELKARGIKNIVTYTSPGVHEWRVWRSAAADFLPRLFR